ncbi:MAG: carboxypeptidase [Lachnospiraceae bacterium]
MARPRGTDSARVVRVIATESLRGEGTQEDLCRTVTQYWDFDGNLLAENDPCEKEKE